MYVDMRNDVGGLVGGLGHGDSDGGDYRVVQVVMVTMCGDDNSLNLPMMFSGRSLAAKK